MRHLKKKQILSVNMHDSLPEFLHQGIHQLDKICKILVVSYYTPTLQFYFVDRLLKLMIQTFCPCINMSVNAAINELFLVMAKFLLTVVHWKGFVILGPMVQGSVFRLTGFGTRFFLGTLTQLFLDVVAFDVLLKSELLLMLHLFDYKKLSFYNYSSINSNSQFCVLNKRSNSNNFILGCNSKKSSDYETSFISMELEEEIVVFDDIVRAQNYFHK